MMSPATRKHTRWAHAHRGVALFILSFTVLIALLALAPLNAVGQRASASGSSDPSSPLFLPVATYKSGGQYATSLAVSDLNGDGNPDLAVVNNGSGSVGVLLGNDDGTFQAAVTYSSGSSWAVGLAVADVNRDSKPDLLVTTLTSGGAAGIGVLLGKGDGSFQPSMVYATGGDVDYSVAVTDVNGDGKPDIVTTSLCNGCANGAVHVLLGNGDGTFQSPTSYSSGGVYASGIAVADVNGDGKKDLVVTNYCISGSSSNCANGTFGMVADGSAGVLLGNGDGTFQPVVSYDSGGKTSWAVAVADVNGDGKPDLVVTNACGNSSNCSTSDGLVGVLLGNGSGTFQTAVSYDSGGWYSEGVAIADVNGDGKLDLLVTNYAACLNGSICPNGSINVLLGKGDGTFQRALSYNSGASDTTSVAVADLNRDGKPDLVVANYFGGSSSNSLVGVLMNNTGIHSPTSTSLISSLNPSIYGQKVTWTAAVTSSGPFMPTGKVRFTWGTNTIGSATINSSGVATLTRSNLNADAYPLTAVYVGDADNLGSISAVLNQVVRQTTSKAMLTSSPNPSTQGQSVTFTATISSPTVVPTGPVAFTAGTTVLGTAQLSSGKARLTISSLPVGSTKVTATYFGNSNIAKSTASVMQTVQ